MHETSNAFLRDFCGSFQSRYVKCFFFPDFSFFLPKFSKFSFCVRIDTGCGVQHSKTKGLTNFDGQAELIRRLLNITTNHKSYEKKKWKKCERFFVFLLEKIFLELKTLILLLRKSTNTSAISSSLPAIVRAIISALVVIICDKSFDFEGKFRFGFRKKLKCLQQV